MAEQFDAVWENLYQAGRAMNRYPFDVVVSLTARYFGGVQNRERVRVLDLGSGAGNHALFFAREGFDVTCVEASATALEVTRSRFEAEALAGKFLQLRFDEIGSLVDRFDLVLDRGSLCTADSEDVRTQVMPALHERLAPDGLFISWFLSAEHPHRRFCGERKGYTYYKVGEGSFGGATRVTLLDETGVRHVFERFQIVQLYHSARQELFVEEGEPALGPTAEYIVVCRRREGAR